MEGLLATYQVPYDPTVPVICMDEASKHLMGEVTTPLRMRPGQAKYVDYEYERLGVCTEFIFCEPLMGWRHVKVTDRRTKKDWAQCIRELVDVYYPHAQRIRLVLENQHTHTGASLHGAFPPVEARRILERLEFHYTPKHPSWLRSKRLSSRSLCIHGFFSGDGPAVFRASRSARHRAASSGLLVAS
jgi:hypothetical protein